MRFSPDLSAAINQFCRQHGVTPFMTLLAAFQTVLHHYSRQQFVCVGSPVANRTRVETENVIGYFINMLLLNTDFGGDPTFVQLVERVRQVTLDALEHQEIPLGLLAGEGNTERDLHKQPPLDVMFVLQNNERANRGLAGISASGVHSVSRCTATPPGPRNASKVMPNST